MAKSISILCVHGVGHGEADLSWQADWTQTITTNLQAWNPSIQVTTDFLAYDDVFQKANLSPATYAIAMGKLLASGVVHGIGDLFTRSRGLFELPDEVRWTAGMIAQWATSAPLRKQLSDALTKKMTATSYDAVFAHSLGSLICYDSFRQDEPSIQGKVFLTFGSQIGNPFVRDTFAGRIEPLPATEWYHLYNPQDHVLTAEINITADNFIEIGTDFDVPNDSLNHNPIWYFNNSNTKSRVWRDLAGVSTPAPLARSLKAFSDVKAEPTRRALLIGINNYPDPANRLEGCINDTFLISSTLQECGFEPEDIRMVLNERATADGIRSRLHWLLDDLCDGDERVLFYSGHGAKIPAYGPSDEVDHMDECLVPYDFDWTPQHAITDKEFLQLYSQLPYNAYFTAIFDCCHAGGMTRDGSLRPRGITPPDDIRHRIMRWNIKEQMWEQRPLKTPNESLHQSPDGTDYLGTNGATERLGRAVQLRSLPRGEYDKRRKTLGHYGPYLPVLLEACQENQLAYEYRDGANSYGAFSYCLTNILRTMRQKTTNPTFKQLNTLVAERLEQMKYNQKPNLVGPDKIISQKLPWSAAPKPRTRSTNKSR